MQKCQKKCKDYKKIALELSENSRKNGSEEHKTVQKQDGNTIKAHTRNKMNTKPSKIARKGKILIPKRNFSTHS